jgi:hypothetical protein
VDGVNGGGDFPYSGPSLVSDILAALRLAALRFLLSQYRVPPTMINAPMMLPTTAPAIVPGLALE